VAVMTLHPNSMMSQSYCTGGTRHERSPWCFILHM